MNRAATSPGSSCSVRREVEHPGAGPARSHGSRRCRQGAGRPRRRRGEPGRWRACPAREGAATSAACQRRNRGAVGHRREGRVDAVDAEAARPRARPSVASAVWQRRCRSSGVAAEAAAQRWQQGVNRSAVRSAGFVAQHHAGARRQRRGRSRLRASRRRCTSSPGEYGRAAIDSQARASWPPSAPAPCARWSSSGSISTISETPRCASSRSHSVALGARDVAPRRPWPVSRRRRRATARPGSARAAVRCAAAGSRRAPRTGAGAAGGAPRPPRARRPPAARRGRAAIGVVQCAGPACGLAVGQADVGDTQHGSVMAALRLAALPPAAASGQLASAGRSPRPSAW